MVPLCAKFDRVCVKKPTVLPETSCSKRVCACFVFSVSNTSDALCQPFPLPLRKQLFFTWWALKMSIEEMFKSLKSNKHFPWAAVTHNTDLLTLFCFRLPCFLDWHCYFSGRGRQACWATSYRSHRRPFSVLFKRTWCEQCIDCSRWVHGCMEKRGSAVNTKWNPMVSTGPKCLFYVQVFRCCVLLSFELLSRFCWNADVKTWPVKWLIKTNRTLLITSECWIL